MNKNDKYLISFKKIKWENLDIDVKQKVFVQDNQMIRLVEFTEKFIEDNWCINGHVGYVLKGEFFIDFDGDNLAFKAGDGIFILDGIENKHKAIIPKGQKVLVVLFEKVI